MKLLIIDPNLSLTSPSMKGVVRSLPALKARGWEIEAWCWHCDEGLPVRVVKMPRLGKVHTLGSYAFAFWVRLRRWWMMQVKGERPADVVFTLASYEPACDVCLVQFSPFDWEQRQKLLGIHSLRDAFERVTNLVALAWTRWFFRRTKARVILAVSDAVAADVRRENARLDVRVLPNCYDPGRFHKRCREEWRGPLRTQLGFAAEDKVFIFVSMGHYRRKGFFLAVDAVARLRDGGTSVGKLLVVGGQEERLKALQTQLDSRHPSWREWITFTGMVPDVERYYAASDAFLFPSYSEAFALVEVEAAACGLPLFLTRHHGSEMILEDGVNGRFMDFDAEQMAGVLAEFVSGAWRPQPGHRPKHALDSEEYAQRLAVELASACDGRRQQTGELRSTADEAHCLASQVLPRK